MRRLVELAPEANGDLLRRRLDDPRACRVTLLALLTQPPDSKLVSLAIEHLDHSDHDILDMLILRKELPTQTQARILREAEGGIRAMFAIAMISTPRDNKRPIADEMLDEWLDAIMELRVGSLTAITKHHFLRLVTQLAKLHPGALEELVFRSIDSSDGVVLFGSLGFDVRKSLHVLPRANKSASRAIIQEHPMPARGRSVENGLPPRAS